MNNRNRSVLFVCMGNICRSPSAEGFFLHHLAESSLDGKVTTDSAGTHGYHIGHPPDSRAISVASEFGVDISHLQARKVQDDDFRQFDLIIAMDDHNDSILQSMAQASAGEARVVRMMGYSSRNEELSEVPDPYYGSETDFRFMCELLDEATQGLIEALEKDAGVIG